MLNKAVRTIQWQGAFYEEGDNARDFPVRVECEDGDAFLADHVIITVPLGEEIPSRALPVQPVGIDLARTCPDAFLSSCHLNGRSWEGV